MPEYPETPLDRAVARAINAYNRAFLNDPEAQAEARALGTLYRRVFEAQERGHVQRTDERGYPTETLEEFVQRAGERGVSAMTDEEIDALVKREQDGWPRTNRVRRPDGRNPFPLRREIVEWYGERGESDAHRPHIR